MDEFKRIVCSCAVKFYKEIEQYNRNQSNVASDSLTANNQLSDAEIQVRRFTHSRDPTRFEIELIVIPCTRHLDAPIGYIPCILDLPSAIERQQRLSGMIDDEEIATHLAILARLRHLYFVSSKHHDHLIYAITVIKRCLRMSAIDNYHRAMYEAELGMFHHSSFHHFGSDPGSNKDITLAIGCMQRALGLCSYDCPPALQPYLHRELGSLLLCDFRSGTRTQLDEAIYHLRRSVRAIKGDDRGLRVCLSLFTVTLISRFESRHDANDLDDAIIYQKQFLALLDGIEVNRDTGAVSVFQPTTVALDALTLYSTWLTMRFVDSGVLEDLQLALRWAEFVVERTPHGSTSRARRVNCLANCLMEKFQVYGRIEDINYVISLVEDTPDPRYAYSIGKMLLAAFERFKVTDHISGAVFCLEKAVAHTDVHLNALSNFEAGIKEHLGHHDMIAVQEMMELPPLRMLFSKFLQSPGALAVPRLYNDWVYVTSRLNLLGLALTRKYESSLARNETDIERAIHFHSRAISMTPDTSHYRLRYHLSLGVAYRVRFEFSRNIDDIDGAIKCQNSALLCAPAGHPSRIQLLSALAQSVLQRSMYPRTEADPFNQARGDYEWALSLFKEAVHARYGFPHDRLSAAVLWASLLHNKNDKSYPTLDEAERFEKALEGYQQAIILLARVASTDINATSRLAQLWSVPKGLASDAAACAFRLAEIHGSNPTRSQWYIGKAVELLDQGRTVLWSQAAQLRADIKLLSKHLPDLAKRLREVSQELEQVAFRDLDAHSESLGQSTKKLGEEWDTLVRKVRRDRRFRDFLRPIPFEKLRAAAYTAPIVIVNVSEYRCDALIIPRMGDLQVIHLDRLDRQTVDHEVADLLKLIEMPSDRGKFRRMLHMLWETVGEPVLRGLEKFGIASRFLPPPHIRWCLTGRLAFLPIHAACPAYGKGKEGMLDYVASSYIPTLSTLLRIEASRSMPADNYPRVLAVHHSGNLRAPLPCAKMEIDNLRKHAGTHHVCELSENEAISESVLREMRTSDWVHFACHGKQDVATPMESALILHDGPMPVSRIAIEVASTGEFAMLLACETAMGSPALSDEAIHVAAGLHFAGFRGAVATMWSIRDDLGPIVADSVYGIMFGKCEQAQKLNPVTSILPAAQTAPYALRETLLKLRDGKLTQRRVKAREWAPFIHYGL